jgi:hypothetical protein
MKDCVIIRVYDKREVSVFGFFFFALCTERLRRLGLGRQSFGKFRYPGVGGCYGYVFCIELICILLIYLHNH